MKLIALLVTLFALSACPRAKDAAGNGAGDVIDCATEEAVERVAEYAPALELLLQRSTSDGGMLDVPTLEKATQSLKSIGWCAVEKTFSRALSEATKVAAGGPQSSELVADPAELQLTLQTLRARLQAGKRFVNVEAK